MIRGIIQGIAILAFIAAVLFGVVRIFKWMDAYDKRSVGGADYTSDGPHRFERIDDEWLGAVHLQIFRDTHTGQEYLTTKNGYSGGVCLVPKESP